jgi:hypothetical protein
MANKLFKDIGSAGGHREKARAEIPFANLSTPPEQFNTDKLIKLFDKYFKLIDKKEKEKVKE